MSRRLSVAAGALAVAVVLFVVSLDIDGITWSFLVRLLAAVGGLVAVGLTSVDARRWGSTPTRIAGPAAVIGGLGALVGAVAFVRSWPWIWVAGAAILPVGAAGIVYELKIRGRLEKIAGAEGTAQGNRRLFSGMLGIGVLVAAILAWRSRHLFGGADFSVLRDLGLVLAAVLVVVKFTTSSVIPAGERLTRPRDLAAVCVVFAVLVALAMATDHIALAVFVLCLVILFFSIWAAAQYEVPIDKVRATSLAVGGLVFVLLALVAAVLTIGDIGVGILIVVAATVAGVYFIWPGEAGYAVVLIVFLVVWAAGDVADVSDPADSVGPEVRDWVVAIGDSYISGEGADEYFVDTSSWGDGPCRRSPAAWPFVSTFTTSEGDPIEAVKTFACSGATIDHVVDRAQHVGAPLDRGGATQLEAFTAWLDDRSQPTVHHLLVSAGGNDSGFSKVIAACVIPRVSCTGEVMNAFEVQGASVVEPYADMLRRLDETLTASGNAATSIIVNPYPDPFGGAPEARCGTIGGRSLLTEDEARAITGFRNRLNDSLFRAVGLAQADMDRSILFNGGGARVDAGLCTSTPRMNWLEVAPTDGIEGDEFSELRTLTLAGWANNSGHPNELGHRAIAGTVNALIARWRADAEDLASYETMTPVDPPASTLCDDDQIDAVRACTDAWLAAAARTATSGVLPGITLALIAGALLGAALRVPAARIEDWLDGSGPTSVDEAANVDPDIDLSTTEPTSIGEAVESGHRS